MSYDTAGNLTTDTYSGGGTRSYDAENKMTQATDAYNNPIARYTYDAEGKRVKRIAQGQEVWQVYGLGGELLAEYTSAGTAAPKEYGYRDGQLLITASPNLDAQAQSSMVVHLYQTILNRTPSAGEVQYWLNQGLTNVDAFKSVARQMFDSPEYTNRNRTDREFVYDCYAAYLYREPDQGGWDFWTGLVPSQGRVNIRENGFASSQEFADRVARTLAGETLWMTADQLGTPRIISDASGSLANIKRHDYLPFGEELTTQGGRTPQQGYSGDTVRQQFAGSERDDETNLDFMQARYYSSAQGRFTSVDPLLSSGRPALPQSWNRYTYCVNNPLALVDPTGLDWYTKNGSAQPEWFDDDPGKDYKLYTNYNYWGGEGHGYVHLNRYANEWSEGYATQEQAASGTSLKEMVHGMVEAYRSSKSLSSELSDAARDPIGAITNPSNSLPLMLPGPFSSIGSAIGETSAASEGAQLGNKLEYIFGNATGSAHNVERSTQMLQQMQSVGLPDTAATRTLLQSHLDAVISDASNIVQVQNNGRVVRESLLMGPQGGIKVESIWEGSKLITVKLYGGK